MTTVLGHRRRAPASLVLFLAMFAAQSSLLVMTPILPAVAEEFEVSVAATAQLRSVTGLVAGCVAIWVALRSTVRPLRDLLVAGLALLVAGTATSAVAPSIATLVLGQLSLGVGLGVLLPTALAAAGSWEPDRERVVLAWALAGQPVAWIVGMPIVGAVAEIGWRHAWVALPLTASLAALAVAVLRERDAVAAAPPDEPPMWREPGTRGWALGELLAYGGWSGTLVFIGALLVHRHGTTTTRVGVVLAVAAAAYLPGNFLARRWAYTRLRGTLVAGSMLSAIGVWVLGAHPVNEAFSATMFAALAFVNGGRTFAGSALGLRLAPRCRLQSMGFRTAAVQYGYLLGAAVGGVAVTFGGYTLLGGSFAVLFVVAALPHLLAIRSDRTRRPTSVG